MKKRILAILATLLIALSFALTEALPIEANGSVGIAQAEQIVAAKKKKKNTPTPTAKPKATPTKKPKGTPAPTVSPVPDGPIIDPQSIADYIFANHCLPDNFITKAEAKRRGWDSSINLSDVAPGFSIGGDRFGNYEGLLPKAEGRQYYECDCYYTTGKRNAHRIVYSNDGLVYYTADHYTTFTEMHPSVVTTAGP